MRRARDFTGMWLWHSRDGGKLYVPQGQSGYYFCASCDAAGRDPYVGTGGTQVSATWTNASPGPDVPDDAAPNPAADPLPGAWERITPRARRELLVSGRWPYVDLEPTAAKAWGSLSAAEKRAVRRYFDWSIYQGWVEEAPALLRRNPEEGATYRERRLARAERLREWAEKRQRDAAAVFAAGEVYRGDVAFYTQPGHIPERARVIAREDRALESMEKARAMEARAAGIEAQAGRAIYSDDPDAVQALEAKVVAMEAQRERMKAANAVVRRFKGDPEGGMLALEQIGFTAGQAQKLFEPDFAGRLGFPSYATTNLSANIRRLRERIVDVERRAQRTAEAEAAPGGVVVRRAEGADWCTVTFAEKPPREVLDALRSAGFRWGAGSWSGPASRLPPELGGGPPAAVNPDGESVRDLPYTYMLPCTEDCCAKPCLCDDCPECDAEA